MTDSLKTDYGTTDFFKKIIFPIPTQTIPGSKNYALWVPVFLHNTYLFLHSKANDTEWLILIYSITKTLRWMKLPPTSKHLSICSCVFSCPTFQEKRLILMDYFTTIFIST